MKNIQCLFLLLSVAAAGARHLAIIEPPPTTVHSTVTSQLEARQLNPTTQASVNNALCFPSPSAENGVASEQALDRGVPYFLNDVLTQDFIPNHGNNPNKLNGWFDYFWTTFDDNSNPASPAEEGCNSFIGTCVPYAKCSDVAELFWNQNTIVNFRNYLASFDDSFNKAVVNVTTMLVKLENDFPIVTGQLSAASIFGNIGAGLSIVGAGAGIIPGTGPLAFAGVLGAIFSSAGNGLQQNPGLDNLITLSTRLSNISTQVAINDANLMQSIITGDLSMYPSRVYANSAYTIPLVAFFDNGDFLYPTFTEITQLTALRQLLSHQILTTLAGTAILEANYFISTASYNVANCPTGKGQTGMVRQNLCFTLEAPGAGVRGNSPSSVQMDAKTLDTVENYYQISLSDIYSSSYDCQTTNNKYSSSVDFNNLALTETTIPPCFYSLPVLEATICDIVQANLTGGTRQVGKTYFPDNLGALFTQMFCTPVTPTTHNR